MHYCLADARINSATNCSKSCEKMVKIGSVVFELNRGRNVSGGKRRIISPNSLKSVIPLRRYCDFSNLQDGRRRHLGFLTTQNFIGYSGGEGRDASACQLLSKSVNRLRIYEDF